MRITITDKIDELNKTEYEFNVISDFGKGLKINISEVLILQRETTRHKFKVIKKYDSCLTKDNTLSFDDIIIMIENYNVDKMKLEIIKYIKTNLLFQF